jgi:DNA (cytosine-5)-methyltransferase 1
MTKDKLTVNELFSGIGAQRKAFERLGIPHEVVGICEIDKYAIQSYEAIFGKTKNYGDICTAPRLDYADLWTYSFPCQDISVAGNQKGISEGTRSGLLYQVQRLLEVAKDEGTLPKYLLLENVKNLVGKKFKSQFDNWLFYLDQLGYDTYWQVLNAKNYGIPQNRERVFAVSIRKDLNQKYEFPKAEPLTKKLADILEDEVHEKYYLSEKCIQGFLKHNENHEAKGTGFLWKPRDLNSHASCLRANGALAPTDNTIVEKIVCEQGCDEGLRFFKDYAIGTLRTIDACGDKRVIELPCVCASRGCNPENPSDRTVGAPTQQRLELNIGGVSNTLTTVQKDNYVVEAKIQQVEGNLYPNSGNPQAGRVYKPEGISPALDTCQGGNRMPKIILDDTQGFDGLRTYEEYAPTLRASRIGLKTFEGIRIRKLTPLECWRLMGFDDEDFKKAEASGVSNTQLYKQAGNSIVVNVLEKIFKNLYREVK